MQYYQPQYWGELWKEARNNAPWGKQKDLPQVLKCWDQKARHYSENVLGKKGEKRVQRVLNFLEKEGLELEEMRVLDIGAGPGAFTLPLAQRAREVVALEPSKGMVAILKKTIQRNQLQNTRILEKTWQEVDLKKEGLEKNFHLVFASMSPGIKSLEMVEKAFLASKQYCFFSGFAGWRESPVWKELWPQIFGEKEWIWPGDIFYLQNLLYSQGMTFTCRVWEEKKRENLTQEEAVTKLLETLQELQVEREGLEEIVQTYVKNHSQKDHFSLLIRTRKGMILTDITELSPSIGPAG